MEIFDSPKDYWLHSYGAMRGAQVGIFSGILTIPTNCCPSRGLMLHIVIGNEMHRDLLGMPVL